MGDVTGRLRTIADAASVEEWYEPDEASVLSSALALSFTTTTARADAEFIVTFRPQIVAAMLDVIDAAEVVVMGSMSPPELWSNVGEMSFRLARFREVAGE